MANNSNLIIAVIITCILSAGIATGILFATKPWCDKNEKYSLGHLQDLPPAKCGISIYNKTTNNCYNRCKKLLNQNCKGLSDSYCEDQCNRGGPTPHGNDDGYKYGDQCGVGLNYHTPISECDSHANNCCSLKCKGNNEPCFTECTSQAVQGHCMYRPNDGPSPDDPSPDGPPSPGGSGNGGNGGGGNGGGGSPPPSPPSGGGGSNVEENKPFYQKPLGIGLIVFLVLLVGGGGAFLYMRSKKGKRK